MSSSRKGRPVARGAKGVRGGQGVRGGDTTPGRLDPWIPSGQADEDELGPEAPELAHLARDEDADSEATAGVVAAGESDEEAGVSVPPEYPHDEIAPEFGVDTTFSLEDVNEEDDEPDRFEDETLPAGAEVQRELDEAEQVPPIEESVEEVELRPARGGRRRRRAATRRPR